MPDLYHRRGGIHVSTAESEPPESGGLVYLVSVLRSGGLSLIPVDLGGFGAARQ